MQEDIEELKRMEKEPGWQVKENIFQLSAKISKIEDCRSAVEDIVNQPHNTDLL